jgi:4-carboxymuconolactone decarboxylase
MMSDIDPESGSRLPFVKRENLGEVGQHTYDEATSDRPGHAGIYGPLGIWLYSEAAIPHLKGLSQCLRYNASLSGALREIAILAVAREMDCEFQWIMHERAALKEGVSPAVIEIIRQRGHTTGIDEKEAVVIELGRQTFGGHKVTSDLFARAKALFGIHQLVDLVLLMGTSVTSSALLTVADVQLRPGMEPRLRNS